MAAAIQRTIVDTGPLVAVLNANDVHHAWAREVFGKLPPPVFTCEAVLSEAQFLLQERGGDPLAVLVWVQQGVINLKFDAANEIGRLLEYRNLASVNGCPDDPPVDSIQISATWMSNVNRLRQLGDL